MTYEIIFRRKYPNKICPFITNIETRKMKEVELLDLVPIKSPVRHDEGPGKYYTDSPLVEIIVKGMPEGANAFYRMIDLWPEGSNLAEIVQYYHIKKRVHSVSISNLP